MGTTSPNGSSSFKGSSAQTGANKPMTKSFFGTTVSGIIGCCSTPIPRNPDKLYSCTFLLWRAYNIETRRHHLVRAIPASGLAATCAVLLLNGRASQRAVHVDPATVYK